jgi:hypothetical protein
VVALRLTELLQKRGFAAIAEVSPFSKRSTAGEAVVDRHEEGRCPLRLCDLRRSTGKVLTKTLIYSKMNKLYSKMDRCP